MSVGGSNQVSAVAQHDARTQARLSMPFLQPSIQFQSTDDSNLDARAELKQLHLASNCPVLQQLTLILLPIHVRAANVGPIRHGAAPVICPTEPTAFAGEPVHQVKRRRTAAQKPRQGHTACKEQDPNQGQKAMLSLVRLMAQVIIQHDKAIQLHHRQECFVLFVQSSPGSALTTLTQQTLEWKNKWAQELDNPKRPTSERSSFAA